NSVWMLLRWSSRACLRTEAFGRKMDEPSVRVTSGNLGLTGTEAGNDQRSDDCVSEATGRCGAADCATVGGTRALRYRNYLAKSVRTTDISETYPICCNVVHAGSPPKAAFDDAKSLFVL